MQKKAAVAGDSITIFIARMGQDGVSVTVPKDTTVREALSKSDVGGTTTRTEYFVSGVRADMDDVLENGDVLSLTTPKQAGV